MSLIEVIASVTILATSVSAILLAQVRGLDRVRAARLEMTATDLTRNLIRQWRLEEIDLAVPAQGHFEDRSGWYWQRSSDDWRTETMSGRQVTLRVSFRDLVHDEPWERKFVWLKNDHVQ